ncbi:MAG: Tlg2-vesicle protein [Caeruleum heppii]|nr:MAG: Tlg2-vesicle protein [Caeruleum heppii]
MPADYGSTARALALPPSPPPSPPVSRPFFKPAWTQSDRAEHRSRPNWLRSSISTRTLLSDVRGACRQLFGLVAMMTWWQRLLAGLALLAINVLGLLFLIFNERIFAWLMPVAKRWRDVPAGWLVLWAMTFFCAFPPLVGYSTAVSIAGFVYGFPNGWFVVASATVAGSLCSFLLSRTVFSSYVQRLVSHDTRFAALALTLKHDGLKLLIMIRLCPLPYSLSNGALSTLPTVRPLTFALATALATPKLMIHVFIGARLALIAEEGGKMSAGTKAVNYASIAAGALLGTAVGWIIYQRTMHRARELEVDEQARTRDPASHDGSLDRFSDDLDSGLGPVLMQNDDISLFDHDTRRDDRTNRFTDAEDAFVCSPARDDEETLRLQSQDIRGSEG